MALTLSFSSSDGFPRLRRVRNAVKSAAHAIVAPHAASLARLYDIPLTLAGAGLIDFAAFHLTHGWGFLITGLSLLLIEHMIADR